MHLVSQILWFVFSVIGAGFLIWLVVRTFQRTDDPVKLAAKWIFTFPLIIGCIWMAHQMGPYGPFLIAFVGVILSIMWTPHLSDMLISSLTDLFDGGKEPPIPKPFYSIALAKRKRGEFSDAMILVREQLAKFPNDYEGVLLLAAIQAEDLKDLQSAEITLNQFCDWEKAPPMQIASALTQLADWQLKIVHDSTSARMTLERIIAKFPDSEFSKAAAQRIAHLGGAEKILLSAHDRRPVFVPEGEKSAGLRESIAHIVPPDANPAQAAVELVKHLETHPLDIEAREQLAVIYAQHYQRLDMAAGELQQLIQQRAQSPRLVAHWLNLLADLQIKAGADYETVAPTLEKIIELFPALPVADLARSRLSILRLEIKGKREAPENKTLGEYEQNIGIKYGKAYGQK